MAVLRRLNTAKSGCKGAVAPIFLQEAPVLFNTALDGTVATVIGPVLSGDPAYCGGVITNAGCEDLVATVTFLNGADCDSCSIDTIVPVDIVITVPGNTEYELPTGFWSQISYVLAAAATDNKPQTVTFETSYTPDCPECIVLVP